MTVIVLSCWSVASMKTAMPISSASASAGNAKASLCSNERPPDWRPFCMKADIFLCLLVIARTVNVTDLAHQLTCLGNRSLATEAVILSHKHRNNFAAVAGKFHSEGRIAAAFFLYLRFY